jgi:hypothetical protein
MTPIQKRLEKLETDMQYVKKVADGTKVVNEKISLMFDWLTDNLTDEQKDSLSKFILSKEELGIK